MAVTEGHGSPSPAALRQIVELTIDEVRRIGRVDVEAAKDDALDGLNRFRTNLPPCGIFGRSPQGTALERISTSSHQQFQDVLDHVVRQLREFADGIVASADTYERSDQAVQQALASIQVPDSAPPTGRPLPAGTPVAVPPAVAAPAAVPVSTPAFE